MVARSTMQHVLWVFCALKLSINTAAFADCSTYMTSDGQAYVPLVISMGALQKVLSGERAVTTVTQLHD